MRPNQKMFTAFAILQWLLAAGCKIEFAGISQVNDRGDITRTTTYRVENLSDKEELLRRYGVPEGGEWKEEKKVQSGKEEIEYVYHITRKFPLKEQPSSDYVRFNETHTRFAKNRFEVKVKEGWFVRLYEYREQFEDVRDSQVGEDILEELLGTFVNTFKSPLESQWPPEEIEPMADELTSYYRNILGKTTAHILTDDSKARYDEKFWENLEQEISIEKAQAILLERFPAVAQDESKKELIGNALDAGKRAAEEYWNNEPRQTLFMESLQGVHGVHFLQTYPFTITLVMPGKILASNGSYGKGQIVWTFTEKEFDQELLATSRKFFWGRLVLSLILLVILAIIFTRRVLRG